MTRNPARTPVLIGAAQFSQRDVTLDSAASPVEMFDRIAREAAAAARPDDPKRLLASLDAIALTNTIGWTPQNPCRLIAEALGAEPSIDATPRPSVGHDQSEML